MPSSFSTVSFFELAADLQKVATWLSRLGINESRTRLGDYRRVMQTLADAHARMDREQLRSLWPSSLVPLFETQELVDIHRWLAQPEYDAHVRERMRIVASGPASYTDEDTSSGNRARNTAFELALAARIVGGGLQLDQTVPSDVAVQVATRTLALECKRPQSEGALERNCDDARRQLRKRYEDTRRPDCIGVIAIDLTKIFVPAYDLLRGVTHEGVGKFLGDTLAAFSRKHEGIWQKNRDQRTAAVLLRLNVMAQLAGETGLTSCQQVVVAFMPDVDQTSRGAIESFGAGFVRT